MIDPENPVLREDRGDRVVDLPARGEVVAKRFFEADADIAVREAGAVKSLDRRLEQAGRRRQEDRQSLAGVAEFVRQILEVIDLRRVQRLIVQPLEEGGDLVLVLAVLGQVLFERFLGECAERIVLEHGPRGAGDRHAGGQQPVLVEAVERRQQHALR